MKKQNLIKRMALSAVFAALIGISTTIAPIHIPATGGYVHLGDGFVLLAGFVLGPVWGAAAAAIGSSAADLYYAAFTYVPATFIIKGLVAAVASLISSLLKGRKAGAKMLGYAAGGVVGELIMVAGYFAYEAVLFSAAGAVVAIPLNLLQAASGVIISLLLVGPLMKIKYIRELIAVD